MDEASAFDLSFERVASFSGKAVSVPLVLQGGEGVDAVKGLQRMLEVAMAKAALGPTGRLAFTPHVTLAYAGASTRCWARGRWIPLERGRSGDVAQGQPPQRHRRPHTADEGQQGDQPPHRFQRRPG